MNRRFAAVPATCHCAPLMPWLEGGLIHAGARPTGRDKRYAMNVAVTHVRDERIAAPGCERTLQV